MGNLDSMDYREFRRLREGGTTNLPPASEAMLARAAAKLRSRLQSSAMFGEVLVETTDDTDRLLVAGVRYRPGTPVQQVSSHLEAVWVAELRLSGLDAFNFLTKDGHVELEAVTGDKEAGYFLTLHLLAEEGTAEMFELKRTAGQDSGGDRAGRKSWFRR